MAAYIDRLVSPSEQATLSPSELETLYKYGDLYRRVHREGIFDTIAGTLGAVGDIVGGGVTATSLLSKHRGPGDTSERKAHLLRTLAEYQNARREERGRVESARVTQIGELAGKESDLKKFALEQRVKMYNKQVDASKSIQVAQLNQYDNAVNDADEEVIRYREPVNANEASRQMRRPTRAKYEKLLEQMELKRRKTSADAQVSASSVAILIGRHTGDLDEEEAHLVIRALGDQYGGTNIDISHAIRLAKEDGLPPNAGAFDRLIDKSDRGEKLRLKQFEQAEDDRDSIHTEYMRGWGVSQGHPLENDLIALQNARGEDGVSQAMGSMGIQVPAALQQQTQDRGLEDDETVLRLKAEIAKLDDPNYLFPGSPHQQLRQKIEDSPEYRKWVGETYGDGPVDPSTSFSQFLAVTKGELTPTASMRAMDASNAITGAASVPLVDRGDALRGRLAAGVAAQPGGVLGVQAKGAPRDLADPSSFGLDTTQEGAPKLTQLLQQGLSRQRAHRFADTDSTGASPMLASAAQGYSLRLQEQLKRKPLFLGEPSEGEKPSWEDLDEDARN